jgi:DNA-binding transcriptional regulator YiaG
MGKKQARKTKGPELYVEAVKVSKKGTDPRTVHSGKPHHYTPKDGVAVVKSKGGYGSHTPSGLKLHDASQEPQWAGTATSELEAAPQEQEAELANRLVDAVADSSVEVNALCENYKLKREELGRLTGFSLRALAEWAAGKLPSQPAQRRLREVRRLLDALAEIVKRESIPRWLHQRNKAFGGLTPLQVIELGEIDRLWAMVHDLGSGQPE